MTSTHLVDTFQESVGKNIIRQALLDSAEILGRQNLTYLGLPGKEAYDVKLLGKLLGNVMCVDTDPNVIRSALSAIGHLPLNSRDSFVGNVWHFLKSHYMNHHLTGDITFLDFCGGGLKAEAFAHEIAGLRQYFAKNALIKNKAFVFAWTYMPRDSGEASYLSIAKCLSMSEEERSFLKSLKGVPLRSMAIRFLIRQQLMEHNLIGSVYQHVLYKKSMNALIVIFSNGRDPNCKFKLEQPDSILNAIVTQIDESDVMPKLMRLY